MRASRSFQHQQEPDTSNAIVVDVPLTIRRRGGRKLVISPVSAAQQEPGSWSLQDAAGLQRPASAGSTRHAVDEKLVQTLVRAFRWKQKLETGAHATISDLAAAEKLDTSLVSRTLRLTLLAPDLVEAILDGRQPDAAQRQTLLHKMPDEWCRQMM
jgi:hypothetical protein